MSKATEAIRYMIAVWDEVQGSWRETPDHVQRKFLEAEAELKQMTNQSTNTTPDSGANNQPTVNERLDEIIRRAYRGEVSWIHDQLQGTSVFEEALRGVDKDILNTKQALISLNKELVAEAKPEYKRPEDAPVRSDMFEWMGYNKAVNEFEQNLLKALEES